MLALALLMTSSLSAQNAVRYQAQPGVSKMKIEGTSTIHDWTAETTFVGGVMELDPAFDQALKNPGGAPKVDVVLPVRQLKSSGGSKMDAVMYEHMNIKEYPTIKYHLLELAPKAAAAGSMSAFDAKGALTVSGVTRTNTMSVTFERLDPAKIKVKGTANLKMTDFGVKPPAPSILGMSPIKTGNDIKLSFEWVIAQAPKTAETK